MIQGSYNNPLFSSNTVVHAIQHEEDLICNCKEQGLQVPFTALMVQRCTPGKVICLHCKHPGHLSDFCIQPGGKMEGKSVDNT
jgi:hypothetical protein